jgi:hypothetical protein
MSVTMTLTIMITTRSSVIYASKVWFPQAEYDYHTQCNFYTQSVFSTRSAILTGMNVVTTRTIVISARKV